MDSLYETALAPADVVLHFSLGYWCFYVRHLRVQMVKKHFSELPNDPPSAGNAAPLPDKNRQPVWIISHPLIHNTPTLQFGRSVIRYVAARYRRHYVELHETFEHYIRRLSRKRRRELLRKMRKFECASPNCFREYRTSEDMRSFFESAIAVSRNSFQKRLGRGLSEDPEFLEQLMRLAAENKVRGYVLFYDDSPAAFFLGRVNGIWLTGEQSGYDLDKSQFSPGNALIGFMLQDLFANHEFERLDFGTGDADYKVFFSTNRTLCADVYYLPRTFDNVMLVISYWATEAVWHSITNILDTLQVRQRLRKWARRAGRRPQLASAEG